MEPRKAEFTKTKELRKSEKKSRFQIVKLEERIAPTKSGLNHGYCKHHPREC